MNGKAFGLLALVMALVMLVSCAAGSVKQTPTVTHTPVEDATLRFLHIWEEHSETMNAVVHAIEEENPGMRVEVSTVGWDELDRALTVAAGAEDMYDVFFQFGSDLGSMKQRGLLLELDPYMDEEWQNHFLDGALDEYRIDESLWGLPYRGSGVVMLYNRTMFAENGWSVPRTQSELIALMEEMVKKNLIPIAAAGRPDGFQLDALRAILTDYIAQEDGLLTDEERLTGRKTDWQGQLAMGAYTVKSWEEKNYFGPTALSVDQTTALNRFLSGKAAMLLCNTNDIHELRNQTRYAPVDMGSFLVPGSTAESELIFSNASFEDGFAIWSGTQEPEQAVALLKGMTSPEYGSLWAEKTLSVMALKDVKVEDALLDEFNHYFTIAGKYAVKPDYDVGDSDKLKNELFVNYMSSDMTADEYETNYETIVKNAIRAASK